MCLGFGRARGREKEGERNREGIGRGRKGMGGDGQTEGPRCWPRRGRETGVQGDGGIYGGVRMRAHACVCVCVRARVIRRRRGPY